MRSKDFLQHTHAVQQHVSSSSTTIISQDMTKVSETFAIRLPFNHKSSCFSGLFCRGYIDLDYTTLSYKNFIFICIPKISFQGQEIRKVTLRQTYIKTYRPTSTPPNASDKVKISPHGPTGWRSSLVSTAMHWMQTKMFIIYHVIIECVVCKVEVV